MKQIISRVEVLSQDEILMIHRSALNLLSRTGFSAPNDECLRRAAAAGARVDEMGVVRLPNDVTEAMVSRMRSRGHQPAEVVPRLMGTISTQVFITDYRTRTRRYGTTDDILKGLRLADQLRNIPYANAVVVPADVDGRVSDLHAYQQIYTHSTKPGGTYVLSPQTAPFIMDMAEAVGTKAYYLFESVCPLRFRKETLEMGLLFADRGHGLGIAPMIMAGSTAPVTMAGAMVLVVAEVLASNFMVMALTGEPSNYFGHGSHSNDPRTMLCSFGAPNQALLAIASAQMGRFYGIDAGSNSALSDALMPDFQCGFEKAFSALYGALAGTVSIGCQGITGADQGFSFEQLVIDDEWLDACNYVAGGIEVNEETIAEELIHEVGIGGNFLGEEHTAKHLRRNFWPSRLFDRYDFDRWKQLGATELLDRASALVDRLTDGYRDAAPVLDPAKCGALDRIARAGYRKILGADSPYVAR